MAASIPVMILVGGSLIPFLDYRAALLAGDAQHRRSAFTRAKAMLLMALVVIIILRILSDEGFMRIKIGRVDPCPVLSREVADFAATNFKCTKG